MIKQIALHHNFIKVASSIIGFTLWTFIAQQQVITVNTKLPVCFYQLDDKLELDAPEYINVTISGKRKELHAFNPEENAFHLNAQEYKVGTHELPLSHQNLFLPEGIKLVQLKPAHITLQITKSNNSYGSKL